MSAREIIRSRGNALVKRLRELRERGGDRGGSVALIEGPKLLEEAVASGLELLEVAVTPRFEASPRGRRLLSNLAGTPVRLLHEDVLHSLSATETSQGALALARRPRFDEEDLFEGVPLLVVAVGLQDPGNLGGVLRTAEAAGASGAYLAKGCADPFSWKALRGSMGSAFRLPQRRGLAAPEILRRLRERGVRTLATVTSGAQRFDEADLTGPMAIVLGSEGTGLPDTVSSETDARVTIPLRGRVESLNVGIAAGLLLFEAARQRPDGTDSDQ